MLANLRIYLVCVIVALTLAGCAKGDFTSGVYNEESEAKDNGINVVIEVEDNALSDGKMCSYSFSHSSRKRGILIYGLADKIASENFGESLVRGYWRSEYKYTADAEQNVIFQTTSPVVDMTFTRTELGSLSSNTVFRVYINGDLSVEKTVKQPYVSISIKDNLVDFKLE